MDGKTKFLEFERQVFFLAKTWVANPQKTSNDIIAGNGRVLSAYGYCVIIFVQNFLFDTKNKTIPILSNAKLAHSQ